ncbi:PilN domain-containing protein [Methylobrevis albus]|uniref:PilN domain-containing protein n=1 Tax=Methylobrevis albus TaxID=2793297 RepID=A0A931MXZ8_9HYPH|nr:PilN domain-containing protein [Methylobrevis albus]MBH0237847.1 PilN domain-containing protein [Methylobrevis albus]
MQFGSAAAQLQRLHEAFVDAVAPLVGGREPRRRIVLADDGSGPPAVFDVDGATARRRADNAGPRRADRLRPVELRLDPAVAVGQRLHLPAAARDYLGAIVEHRLDRLTPWPPEKVVYGYAVADPAADAPAGTIAVDVQATSRTIADAALARAEAAGFRPTRLAAVAGAPETPAPIDLLRGTRSLARSRLRRTSARLLAVLWIAGIAAVSAAFWYHGERQEELAAVERRFAAQRAALGRTLGAGDGEARALAIIAARRPETSGVTLVDRIARALPDDTFLNELDIRAEDVRLVGSAGDAAALIARIDADPALENVRFSAPVARGEDGRYSFDIAARRVGGADAAAEPVAGDPYAGSVPAGGAP